MSDLCGCLLEATRVLLVSVPSIVSVHQSQFVLLWLFFIVFSTNVIYATVTLDTTSYEL